MALIIRIDVDRPYGRRPFVRHVLSRCASDLYFPRVQAFGYLVELKEMLRLLARHRARAYAFFRRCTLPSPDLVGLLDAGGHHIGLHLENSRSFATFTRERERLARAVGRDISAFSKHGSGGARYGRCHYAPYEPERYVAWAQRAGMKLFLGNLEDPSLEPLSGLGGFSWYPSAFWLEPHWRDTARFPMEWLHRQAVRRDIVLLVHPENVLADPKLVAEFERAIRDLPSALLS